MHVNFAVHIESGAIYKLHKARATVRDTWSEVMEPTHELKFTLNYPLTTPRVVQLVHADGSGWTQREFVEAVRTAYAEIYASEKDPGRAGGLLLNRGRSEGPYGIWVTIYRILS